MTHVFRQCASIAALVSALVGCFIAQDVRAQAKPVATNPAQPQGTVDSATKAQADVAARAERAAQYRAQRAASSAPATDSATASISAGTGTTATVGIITQPAGSIGSVFKVVDRLGRITFTDKVPNERGLNVVQGTGRNELTVAGPGFANLPAGLNRIVDRFPVTLYSGENCNPCALARSALIARGVPFIERTVKSQEDVEALQRISGDSSLPLVTIGGQQIKGFSDVELAQTLDAAEYPRTSLLPASFRNPGATPLVAASRATAVAQTGAANVAGGLTDVDGNTISTRNGRGNPEAAASRAARAEAAAAAAANPTGIKF